MDNKSTKESELDFSLRSKELNSREASDISLNKGNGNSENSLDEVKEHNKFVYLGAWNKKLLYVAYAVLIITAFVESFANNSTSSLDSYVLK